MENAKLYHCPLGPEADAAMAAMFGQLAEVRVTKIDCCTHRGARDNALRRTRGRGVVHFRSELCGGPRSQNDYLEIATQFHRAVSVSVLVDGASSSSCRPPCRRGLASTRPAGP